MTVPARKWWKDAVVYQIYPASFKDSNGDGIGDLPGIISQLDYIKSIGVDVIWICPMYDSPQVDMGYDISDYENVYPPYGTVEDMERLIKDTHEREMRIILDLVVNHTSDQHKWFQESRSSKDNPKRDWYIWRPARYDSSGHRKPPNNWLGNFGGSAWAWDPVTSEYYLHLFCPEQPDLNWENPATRQAIYTSAIEFWLSRGVDGFRVDTVNMYSKGEMLDAPITDPRSEWQFAGLQYCNGPRMEEFLTEMNEVLERYDAMTVGECPNTPDMARVLKYVSAREKQLNMVFQFDVVDIGQGPYKFQTTPKNYTLPSFKAAIERTQNLIRGNDGWTTVFLENHDQSRSISRFASDAPEHRVASGKMLALMMMALSGTMFIYQGQEIGMVNFPLKWSMDEYKDIDSTNYYRMVKQRSNDDATELAAAKTAVQHLARDHARVPFSWDASPNAGFTTGKPWMRANDDYAICNAKQQQAHKNSVLSFWKRMLELRRQYADLFIHGDFDIINMENEEVFEFTKTWQDRKAYVVLNFSDQKREVELPSELRDRKAELLTSSAELPEEGRLAAYEGRVYLS